MITELQEFLKSMERAPIGPHNETGYSNDDVVNVKPQESDND